MTLLRVTVYFVNPRRLLAEVHIVFQGLKKCTLLLTFYIVLERHENVNNALMMLCGRPLQHHRVTLRMQGLPMVRVTFGEGNLW